jgi:FKBP-type peptidyl-prolyl cis-trans isomerase SlyD
METVENKYITVAYKLYSIENGEKDFEEEAPVEHPFQFISGLGMTLEPFEAQIKDLQIGDKFDFTIRHQKLMVNMTTTMLLTSPKKSL